MAYWQTAPSPPAYAGHRREFYYDHRHRYRGEVEQFPDTAPTTYANVPGTRSGAMESWEAAKEWVEMRVPHIVREPTP